MTDRGTGRQWSCEKAVLRIPFRSSLMHVPIRFFLRWEVAELSKRLGVRFFADDPGLFWGLVFYRVLFYLSFYLFIIRCGVLLARQV